MGSVTRQEVGLSLAALADQINTDFNQVAEMLPLDAKTGGAGLIVPVSATEGVGSISTMFLGRNRLRDRFMLRLIMEVESPIEDFGFYKDYELADYQLARGGFPYQTEPVLRSDLYWCPGPVEELAVAIHALHDDYLKLRSVS
jgi:hypothetical protein